MKFHNFVLSFNQSPSNYIQKDFSSLKNNNKNEFISPLKFRSRLRKLYLMSNAENIEKNYQLRQIINQYKSLKKDYNIRKKNNEHFSLYSKKDLEYEEKKRNFKSKIKYVNRINSFKKNNSDFLKLPTIKMYKETINDNNYILSSKNKSNNYNLNNSIKHKPSILMKYLSQTNFFFYQKKGNLKINARIHKKNKTFKIIEIDKLIKQYNRKMYNSTDNLKLKSNLY